MTDVTHDNPYTDLIDAYVKRQVQILHAVEDITLMGAMTLLPWLTRYLAAVHPQVEDTTGDES